MREQAKLPPAKGDSTTIQPSRAQQVVARRMSQSRSVVPDFTVRTRADMGALVALRAELKASTADETPAPSLNDLIVKACAIALLDHPQANGSYVEDQFELHSRINVGIAISGPGTLIVPPIFDADLKSVEEIAIASRDLVTRAQAGTIKPADLNGGTFTVSNLGMLGVDDFDAVVNEPQAAILAVGQLTEEPTVRGGQMVIATLARLNLSCDHRILYGADAARFLGRIREILENPVVMTSTALIAPAQAAPADDRKG